MQYKKVKNHAKSLINFKMLGERNERESAGFVDCILSFKILIVNNSILLNFCLFLSFLIKYLFFSYSNLIVFKKGVKMIFWRFF